MNWYRSLKYSLSLSLLALFALVVSCDNNDGDGVGAQVVLKSFGPSVLRGGELKFVGVNLNKVTAIVLPENVEIPASSFKTHTSTLISIDVPDEAVEGLVTLKTPDGDLVTKTPLGILEPITIESISPNPARPGDVITISGTYLNLISMVEFGGLQQVTEFESQSRTKLEVRVPDAAQTANLLLSDSEEIPNVIESETALAVTVPVAASVSPNPVKAGSALTITGTDLDLAIAVEFAGNERVDSTDFVSVTATQIVLNVPGGVDDGAIQVVAPSSVKSESGSTLVMVVPTITSVAGVSPNVGKNKGLLTVTGENLDLVTGVVFGANKQASPESGRTATQMTVKIPADATDGVLAFSTAANKSVPSPEPLALVKPGITSFTPASVQTQDSPSVTISGNDLDLVSKIVFGGGWEATVNGATAGQIVIPVTPGSVTGTFKLITINGTQVESADPLTIVPDVPEVAGPTEAFTGSFITVTGTNLDVPADVIFPGNVKATVFGSKTATSMEVFVPATVAAGAGKIKFVTYKNEVYESPAVTFKPLGVEPIVDPALVINNFDESGHDLGWDNWGGNVELGNDANVGISGKYLHGTNASTAAWAWIWGCNHSQLPKVSVTTADHVFKMDVKITKAIPAGANFEMEFGGTRISLGNLGGTTPSGGWITITYDLADFSNLPATIPASGEWGMNLGTGTVDLSGLYIDNIRFQAK
jgi:hypothetical protein